MIDIFKRIERLRAKRRKIDEEISKFYAMFEPKKRRFVKSEAGKAAHRKAMNRYWTPERKKQESERLKAYWTPERREAWGWANRRIHQRLS